MHVHFKNIVSWRNLTSTFANVYRSHISELKSFSVTVCLSSLCNFFVWHMDYMKLATWLFCKSIPPSMRQHHCKIKVRYLDNITSPGKTKDQQVTLKWLPYHFKNIYMQSSGWYKKLFLWCGLNLYLSK